MDIVDFFNPHNIEHIKAYEHLDEEGCWPEGFISDDIEFSTGWNSLVESKMAKAWRYYKIHGDDGLDVVMIIYTAGDFGISKGVTDTPSKLISGTHEDREDVISLLQGYFVAPVKADQFNNAETWFNKVRAEAISALENCSDYKSPKNDENWELEIRFVRKR